MLSEPFKARVAINMGKPDINEETWKAQAEHVIETIAEGVLIINAAGIIVYANNSAKIILGRKQSDILEHAYSDPGFKVAMLDGKPYPIEKHPITQVLQTGGLAQNVEYAVERPDGVHVIITANASPLRDEEDVVIGAVLSFTDITTRKKAESELRVSEKKLREITSVLGEGVYVLDKDGNLTFMNPEAERLLDWAEAELHGKDLHEAIHHKRADGTMFPAEECPVLEITNSGLVYRTDDDVFTRKDGSTFPVAYVTTPIVENGSVVASVTTFQDITERKRAEKLRDTLNVISAAINSTLEFDEIMKRVVVEACKAVICESTAIALREDEHWKVKYAYRFPQEVIGVRLADGEVPHMALAARTKKPISIDDVYCDSRVDRDVMAQYGVRSTLVVPLMVKESVIGVLSFNYHSAVVVFKEVEVDFASKLGLAVSLAIENARLYAGQRNIADILQEALLTMPQEIEGVGFGYLYRSATDTARVGGDFYDIFELEHDRVGMIMGDVSGHGLEASTLTALVKSTIKAYAYDSFSPASIIAKTNEVFLRVSAKELFVTVFFGILDIKSGVLTYCSAGHPPAIVERKTSETFFLTTNSPAIGAFSGLNYFNDQEIFRKGDVLILYTDGVIEARRNNEFFGYERLEKLIDDLKPLPAREIPLVIFNEVIDFASGVQSDDVAILVVGLGDN